jgi:hypothetical protein
MTLVGHAYGDKHHTEGTLQVIFIYLFICSLFNNTVSNLDFLHQMVG